MRKDDGAHSVPKNHYKEEEKAYEECKVSGVASRGYLIGRHPECGECAIYEDIPSHALLIGSKTASLRSQLSPIATASYIAKPKAVP